MVLVACWRPSGPRDVPADVLSQLGTLIVHRLTNDHDHDTLEKACGDLNHDAAMFIPTLAPGEAIVIGPDIPAPVPLLMSRPSKPPNSKGQRFRAIGPAEESLDASAFLSTHPFRRTRRVALRQDSHNP
jgi:hypothetical protein